MRGRCAAGRGSCKVLANQVVHLLTDIELSEHALLVPFNPAFLSAYSQTEGTLTFLDWVANLQPGLGLMGVSLIQPAATLLKSPEVCGVLPE